MNADLFMISDFKSKGYPLPKVTKQAAGYTETFTGIEGKLGVKLAKRQTKILEPGQSHILSIGLRNADRPLQVEGGS